MMRKKTIIAFFCATLAVCMIYGVFQHAVSQESAQKTVAAGLEETYFVFGIAGAEATK